MAGSLEGLSVRHLESGRFLLDHEEVPGPGCRAVSGVSGISGSWICRVREVSWI